MISAPVDFNPITNLSNLNPIINQINGFYRGIMFPLWTTGAVNSLMFGVYGNRLRMLQSNCETPNEKQRLLLQHVFRAGTIAGFMQAFLASPFELIKIKLQTHKCEWWWSYNYYCG